MESRFASKLDSFASEAMRAGRADLREALLDLADVITEAFDSELEAIKLDGRRAKEILEETHDAALLVDACHIVRSRLLPSKRAFEDFVLPKNRTYEALCVFIDEVRHEAGDRPFVYVAWKRNPEEYLYVGRSENKDGGATRLKLEARGKLFAALQDSTLMTLMFPQPRTSSVAWDVEAAILAILDDRDHTPEYNGKGERVPGDRAAEHLAQVGRLLVDLGSKFESTRARMTQRID